MPRASLRDPGRQLAHAVVAWEEILRRIDYGQRVEPIIEALARYLVYEMGGWAGMEDDVPIQFELPLGC